MNEKNIISLAEKYFSNSERKIIKGIGDDTAVLEPEKNFQLFTSDMLIEGTHFLLNKISPYNLGWKSLAVNISDIASMGGYPTYATLSIGINNNIDHIWLEQFYSGLNDCAKKYNVNIAGGDTVSSPNSIVINIALLGGATKPVYRNNIKSNYVITATGNLGLSGLGLSLLLNHSDFDKFNSEEKCCIERHVKPFPKVNEGIYVASVFENIAMMDSSDGLYTSLKTFSEQTNLGAEIYFDNFIIPESLETLSKKFNKNFIDYILYGGEDYELIIAIPENEFYEIKQNYFDKFNYYLPLIGKFTDNHNKVKLIYKDKTEILDDKSFQHF